jgi:hypothetical protein
MKFASEIQSGARKPSHADRRPVENGLAVFAPDGNPHLCGRLRDEPMKVQGRKQADYAFGNPFRRLRDCTELAGRVTRCRVDASAGANNAPASLCFREIATSQAVFWEVARAQYTFPANRSLNLFCSERVQLLSVQNVG